MAKERKPRKTVRLPVEQPADPPKQEPKPVVRHGKPLHVWIEPALRDAIDELANKTRRSLTTEVTIALEEYLTRNGLWPRRKPGEQESQS